MKNLFKILAASLVMISFTSAQAEMKYGISASLTQISASGNETENGEKHSAKERNNVVIQQVILIVILIVVLIVILIVIRHKL